MRSPITLCGSLSLHPVSLGAALHSAAYRELQLDWVYVPFAVEESGLRAALDGMRALRIRGFGVSMPFKLQVIPLLDGLDPLARRIGAVNTIVNDEGRLTGFNTDAVGSVRALSEALAPADCRVLVLGAGGAARAVVHALADAGAELTVANRHAEKAEALAEEVNQAAPRHRARGGGLELADALEQFGALVNCTSATMAAHGGTNPLGERPIPRELVVMDIVYAPVRTVLIEQAERAGARTVHGGRMLLHQAARQHELYTGLAAPLDAMDRALERALGTADSANRPAL